MDKGFVSSSFRCCCRESRKNVMGSERYNGAHGKITLLTDNTKLDIQLE